MNMSEAKDFVRPLINNENAVEYMHQTEKGLWVESTIMAPSGIQSSINSDFGERLCNWIEDKLIDLLIDQENLP